MIKQLQVKIQEYNERIEIAEINFKNKQMDAIDKAFECMYCKSKIEAYEEVIKLLKGN